jgi:cell division inhibitor SepF
MALRDTWHRALVYFGLAEDHYDDVEDYYEPDTGSEDAFQEPGGGGEAAPVRLPRQSRRDDIDDIFPEDEPAPSRRSRSRRGGGGGGGAPVLEAVDTGADAQVHMVTPRNFNDAQQVADQFKRSVPVIINLQSTDKELAKRLIDFASGMTYALGGGMQRIAEKVFLLTPANVEVSADEKARLLERGFFNQS